MKYVDIEVIFRLSYRIITIKDVDYDSFDDIMDNLCRLQDMGVIKTIKVVFNGK